MPKLSKTVVDASLRTAVFSDLGIANIENFHKINDRQYGCILTDDNGEERYVRIGAIVAEQREDMTARELMQSEIDKYEAAQQKKEAAALKKAEKIKKDEEKRRKAKEQEGE